MTPITEEHAVEEGQALTKFEQELLAENAALTRALTGLTCGGSEFFVRKGERFVADIEACVAWISRMRLDANRRSMNAIRGQKEVEDSTRDLLSALQETWRVLRAAGTLNLSRGVQLGQTSWYVKICDAEAQSDAAISRAQGTGR